jgi:hypothetical protein
LQLQKLQREQKNEARENTERGIKTSGPVRKQSNLRSAMAERNLQVNVEMIEMEEISTGS